MARINEQIKASEIRVIDENGANLGILPLSEALKLAKEKNLDLIEIVQNANPPVAKIISFDKYRYQEKKKMRKERGRQKTQELKHIRISAREAEHDLLIKADKVNQFLQEGHNVEIQLFLRGREKANKEWARLKLLGFLKIINPDHKVIVEPKYGMRGFTAQVTKK